MLTEQLHDASGVRPAHSELVVELFAVRFVDLVVDSALREHPMHRTFQEYLQISSVVSTTFRTDLRGA